MLRPIAALAAATALATGAPLAARQSPTPLDRFLTTELGAKTTDLAALERGQPLVAVLAGGVDREIAVAGAIKIRGAATRTLETVRDVERLESGAGFIHTRRLSTPPAPQDFERLRISADDLAALRVCRPGRCDVKLGRGAFDTLATIDWRASDAEARATALARRTALEYVEAYRRGGNAELAIYADSSRPTFVAAEFADLVRRSSRLPNMVPALSNYLLDYPKSRAAAFEDIFYWSEADFGLKPVMRINHMVIHASTAQPGVGYVVATKQLYANHYFHTGLEVRALVDDARGSAAHYLVVLNVARSDGLTGLFGGMVKGKVEAASRDGLRRALVATKAKSEARP